MNKEEAKEWVQDCCTNGTGIERNKYRENHGIGKIAEDYWNDPVFTLGIEYGLLIAISRIFEGE